MRLDPKAIRLERSRDGTTFLFEDRYGYAYLLNATGAFLSEALLQGDRDLSSLVAAVLEEFETEDAAAVEADALTFLETLRGYGLLE